MRRTPIQTKGIDSRTIWRVARHGDFSSEWSPEIRMLVRIDSYDELARLLKIASAGVTNLGILTQGSDIFERSPLPTVLELGDALFDGDVLALSPSRPAHVLYRESDVHHTVFLTNRCNSFCLMCSQPPSRHDDSWLIEEAMQLATHIRTSPRRIGFTGGEPLLLRLELRRVLDVFGNRHPGIAMDVLTNGRFFADSRVATDVLEGLQHDVSWLVPLYGHADILHDRVVQSDGAFDETLAGLLVLQEHGQSIQLRIVLIQPTLRILPEFCAFIGKNLPFVREVALMGCEPTGFALANRDLCEVDILDWQTQLEQAIRALQRARVPVIIMNLPLCALPPHLWPYAHRSISDWKQTFAPECDPCLARAECSGLFAWHEQGWRPAPIKPVRE